MAPGMTVKPINPLQMLPESKAVLLCAMSDNPINDTSSCPIILMGLVRALHGPVLFKTARLVVVSLRFFYAELRSTDCIGIERKIREAYRHLCLTYSHEKDEIILIGFSRGAFTARCLASLIYDVGLLDGAWVNKELPAIFELWKKQNTSKMGPVPEARVPTPLELHCQALIAQYDGVDTLQDGTKETILRRGIKVKACAVWDTVKSLGMPLPRPLPQSGKKRFAFVNYKVSPNIENAFQALSLDERRWHFPPVIWSRSHKDQALKQCWFLGAHSDVGGGFSDPGFANISLCWMITQLRELVKFNERTIWRSTEEGRILFVDFVKEKSESRKGNRGRTAVSADRERKSERPRSTPPAGDPPPGDRLSIRHVAMVFALSREHKVQRSQSAGPSI